MKHFNTPPQWPQPPNVRWRPPKGWSPESSWPPAPHGWTFWTDEHGRPVRGPLGRYGGPSRGWLVAAAGAVVVVCLVLFGPFGGDDAGQTSAPLPGSGIGPTDTLSQSPDPDETLGTEPTVTPTPSPTETPSTAVPTPSSPSPTVTPSHATPSTATPSSTPTVIYRNCGEVRAAGKAPLHRGDPGYTRDLDRNGDGIACDRGNS
ncbi:MAG TPA: excalibur calcium-binding domain-containing protein [Kribbella sp.]|nr:excalibur calcium-binding domain-containing protein [Kribbella sp.]